MSNERQAFAPIADLHCDTVIAMRRGYDISKRHDTYHVDIPRLQEGGIDIQVFAASASFTEQGTIPKDHVDRQIDLLHSEFAKNRDTIEICLNSTDIEHVIAEGKIGAILAIEGGQALENDPQNIEYFYDKGIRIITIAHESPIGWCANWKETDPGFHGLTDIGREMIIEMNRLGIILDLSHSSDATVDEVLSISFAPVIASHSNVRALCNHHRNLTNDQIRAIASTGGLIGVTFVNNFISEQYNAAYDRFWNSVSHDDLKKLLKLYNSSIPDEEYQNALSENFGFIIEGEKQFQHLRVSVKDVVDRIDYMVNLVGSDHVAIGSDYDGMSSTPVGLEDCSKMPNIADELLNRRYSEIDISEIMAGNFLKVFKKVCK